MGKLVISVFISVLLSGCMTVGLSFEPKKIEQIVIGKTTPDDLKNMLGEPWRVGLEDGKLTWTYGEYSYYLFAPADTKDLVVRFQNGVVKSYTFNSTDHADVKM